MKKCTKCGEWKEKEFFHKQTEKYDGLRPNCKECRKKFYYENRDKILDQERKHKQRIGWRARRDRNLRYTYGISLKSFEETLKEQNYKCALCKGSDHNHKFGWVVDHCHETGRIRGILCHNCNIKLGHLENLLKTVSLDDVYKYLKWE